MRVLLLILSVVAAVTADGLPDSLPVGVPEGSENDILGEPLTEDELLYEDEGHNEEYTSGRDPIELAGAFEGDIILANNAELRLINESIQADPGLPQRNAVKLSGHIWPNAVIPYVIGASFSRQERANIAAAMHAYHSQTCIKFVARTNQRDYIHLYRGRGCSSMVGRQGGRQVVSLGNGCLYVGVITHELMHAVGFWHEQSRWDRDSYIRINWNNIMAGMAFNFAKYNWNKISHLGEPYDLGSIMHYGAHAFARDTRYTTIDALNGARIGHIGKRGFSKIDLNKLRKLYKCGGTTGGGKCSDESPHCKDWAEKGECTKNPAYMKESCKDACDLCDDAVTCTDGNEHCASWATKGECKKNPAYMSLSCRKACKLC